MNKTSFLTAVVVVLLLLNIGTLGYLFLSREKRMPPGPPGAAVSTFIIERLKLDDKQQMEFARIRQQHQSIMRDARDKDRGLHDAYFDLLKTATPDHQKADSIAQLIALQKSIMEKATYNHFEALRKICRADQQPLFDATIDEIARQFGPRGPQPPPAE